MIAIINLELGNLFSVSRAIEHVGGDCFVTDNIKEVMKADKIILPGVGSYKSGMESIYAKKLDGVLKGLACDGVPILGICLGMQLLMDHSEEHGNTQGLGLIPGAVEYFRNITGFDFKAKVPNVGWSSLNKKRRSWEGTILEPVIEGDDCYFVHSLCVTPEVDDDLLALSHYGGVEFASVIQHQNISGCQFHPEKSGNVGLNIVRNFVDYKA
mgnify:CR=1 FL=1